MMQDPFYQIAVMLKKETPDRLVSARLTDGEHLRFWVNGADLPATGRAKDLSLTAEDEGTRFLCWMGEEGLVPLLRLTEEGSE